MAMNINAKYFSSSKTRNKAPGKNAFGGSVRADMNDVITAGLVGIYESIEYTPLELEVSIDRVTPFKPVYKGNLRKKWKTKYTKKGGYVESGVDHSVFIEDGTKPFTPPYKPIAEWVAKKSGAPRSFIKEAAKIKLSAKVGIKAKKPRSNSNFTKINKRAKGYKRKRQLVKFAAMVAGTRRAIARRGIKPRRFVQSIMKSLADKNLANVLKVIDSTQVNAGQLPGSISVRSSESRRSNVVDTDAGFSSSEGVASSVTVS